MNTVPTHWILRLLRIVCPEDLYEGIEGDLVQRYHRDLRSAASAGLSEHDKMKRARRRLFWNAIRFFRPGIMLRNKFSMELKSLYMLKSYLKSAQRQLVKNKTLSIINIAGLTTVTIFSRSIFLFVVIMNSSWEYVTMTIPINTIDDTN